MLSFSLFSFGIQLGGELLKYVIFPLLEAIAEIFKLIATFLVAGVAGIVNTLEKVPAWIWLALSSVVVFIAIAAAVSEDFRNKIKIGDEWKYSKIPKKSRKIMEDIELHIVQN